MSKRREYANYPATDAPQQSPGTTRQANANNQKLNRELDASEPGPRYQKHKDSTGSEGPTRVGNDEIP